MRYFKSLLILFLVFLYPSLCYAKNWQETSHNEDRVFIDIDSVRYHNNSILYNIIYFDKKLQENVFLTIESKKTKARVVYTCNYEDYMNNKCEENKQIKDITSEFKPLSSSSMLYKADTKAFEKMGQNLGIDFNFETNDTNKDDIIINNMLKAYIKEIESRIKRIWYPPNTTKRENIVVNFNIAKDGKLLDCKILKSSGNPDIDKSAISAIQMVAPFRPLPNGYNKDSVSIEFTFNLNKD